MNAKDTRDSLILTGLLGFLAWLTLTQSGQNVTNTTINTVENAIMNLSNNGVNAIKQFESFSARPYSDAQGMSIGYGHFIVPGDGFSANSTITEIDAAALLLKDAQPVVQAINDYLSVTLNQNQFDALCSFIYNTGINAFEDANNTLIDLLNAGDFQGATAKMALYVHYHDANGNLRVSPALVKRRTAEINLFNA